MYDNILFLFLYYIGYCYKKTIDLDKQRNNLYYLAQDQNPALIYTMCKNFNLGHSLFNSLQILTKTNPAIYFDSKHVCEICPLAKQTRLSFPTSLISYEARFDLIDCDIWRLNLINSYFGTHYFLTSFDDFT